MVSPSRMLLACLLLWGVAHPALGQRTVLNGPLEDYARVLSVGSEHADRLPWLLRPLHTDAGPDSVATPHPWRAVQERLGLRAHFAGDTTVVLPIRVNLYHHTAQPLGGLDGPVWQGVGNTVAVSAGGYVRRGIVEVGFQPVVWRTQNKGFELSPYRSPIEGAPRYAYARQPIDAPQQFGYLPVTRVNWGDSYLRASWMGVRVGYSTAPLWTGPGRHSANVFTNNAGGFWHSFIDTPKPIETRFGAFGGHWFWGHLRESAHFDSIPQNDRRYTTGITLYYSPPRARGFWLGMNRTFVAIRPDGAEIPFRERLLVFKDLLWSKESTKSLVTGNDQRIQYLSFFTRLAMPRSGMEVYGEWTWNGIHEDLRDRYVQPSHQRAYLIGMHKIFRLSNQRWIRFEAELQELEVPRTSFLRSSYSFYTHPFVRQGFTQEGQVLGSQYGPGSNVYWLALDYFRPWGRAGFWARRVSIDNDRFYTFIPRREVFYDSYETLVTTGLRGVWFRGPIELSGTLGHNMIWNRFYKFGKDERSWQAELNFTYHW